MREYAPGKVPHADDANIPPAGIQRTRPGTTEGTMNPGTDQRVVQKTPSESKIERTKSTVDLKSRRSFPSVKVEADMWRTRVGMAKPGDVAWRWDIVEIYTPYIVIWMHQTGFKR